MKYIILLLILFSIFILFNSSVKEGNRTLTDIKKEIATYKAEDVGFKTGFYETGKVMDPNDISDELKDKIYYNKNIVNLGVEYHDPPEVIAKNEDIEFGSVWVYDPIAKKKIAIKRPAMQSNFTYYEPDTYKYGAATYVPSYTDSVLLSRSNNYIGDYIFNDEYEKTKAKQEQQLISQGNAAFLKEEEEKKNK
jgi:hypothetical protein